MRKVLEIVLKCPGIWTRKVSGHRVQGYRAPEEGALLIFLAAYFLQLYVAKDKLLPMW